MLLITASNQRFTDIYMWKAPLQSFPAPDAQFESIVGPMPPSEGYWYLFTCIDRYTRWLEAVFMTDSTAESCARTLLSGWNPCLGVPATITSDQGQRFKSDLSRELIHLLSITRHRTAACHSQAYGLVERFHPTFIHTSIDFHTTSHVYVSQNGYNATPNAALPRFLPSPLKCR